MFTALTAVSCGSPEVDYSKIALDYGYVYKDGITNESQVQLNYGELASKMVSQESFVLLIHSLGTCGCWDDELFYVAKIFMNKYNLIFNSFITNDFGDKETYGIYSGIGGELPGIVFIRRGKVIRQILRANIDGTPNANIFKRPQEFEKYMLDNIYLPKMYYLDRESLDKKISSNEEFNLYVARTGCGDCLAANGVLLDWSDNSKETTIQDNLYIFDLKPYHPGKPDDPGYDEKYPIYIAIKTEYKLSEEGNALFGYDAGYVPTFQRWKNGDVIDMITILNDSAVGEDVKTQSSYFTEARVNASPMLRNTTYIFQGREIGADELDERGKFTRDAQLKQQTPILKLYLSTYVK